MQEHDGNRRDTKGAKTRGRRTHSFLVERYIDFALSGESLCDLKPNPTPGDWVWARNGRIPDVLFETSAELDPAAKPFVNEKASGRTGHLDHGVVRRGRAVN